jgi:hypothetical protein
MLLPNKLEHSITFKKGDNVIKYVFVVVTDTTKKS